MKHYFNYLFALALVMSMQGCSKDLVVTDEPNDPEKFEEVQLRLTGEVAYMTPETRLDANGFEDGDAFGVYVSTKSDLQISNNKADNKKFVYNGSTGVIEASSGNDISWSSNSEKFNIYAYYPYISGVTNANEIPFSIKTDQTSSDNYYGSDFLRATKTNVEKTTEAVELQFKHLMSKISISLTLDESFPEDEFSAAVENNKVELTIEGLITDCTIDLEKEVSNSINPITIGNTKTSIKANGSGKSYTAIIPPQNANDVKFRLRIGDKYYSSTLKSVNYASGKEYSYNFIVKKTSGMSIKSTSISSWSSGGGSVDHDMKQENN